MNVNGVGIRGYQELMNYQLYVLGAKARIGIRRELKMGTTKIVNLVAVREIERVLPSGKMCRWYRRDFTFTSILRRVHAID